MFEPLKFDCMSLKNNEYTFSGDRSVKTVCFPSVKWAISNRTNSSTGVNQKGKDEIRKLDKVVENLVVYPIQLTIF